MKTIYLLLICLTLSLYSSAQLPAGTVAPDFTATDIYGTSYTMSDYLAEGKNVVIVFFATWAGPSWNYHNTLELQTYYEIYGPDGDDAAMVFFVEGDAFTTIDDIYGEGGNTQGDWTAYTPYPIIESIALFETYACSYYPTTFLICANGFIQNSDLISPSLEGLEDVSNTCYTATLPNNPALIDIESTDDFSCAGAADVEFTVLLQNMGTAPLTACQITLNGAIDEVVYEWTGNLATYELTTILFTEDLVNSGPLLASITSPDDVTTDNQAQLDFIGSINGTSHFHIQLLTDNWPEESSWDLKMDGNVVLSSDPYTEVNQVYEHDFYVSQLGCYEFTFYDAWGDGINGEQWGEENGFLNVYLIDELGNIVDYVIAYDGTSDFMELSALVNVTQLVPVTISGIVFEDEDEDGYLDYTENGIGNIEVHLDNMITYTNENGAYSFLDVDDFESLSIVYDELVWPTHTTETTVDISAATDATFNFGLSANDPNYDVSFQYSDPWMYFCQFESSMWLCVNNNGNSALDEVVANITLDPLLTFISADPEAVVVGNTVTWNITDLAVGEIAYLTVTVMVPSFEFMGSPIVNTVTVDAFVNDVVMDSDTESFPDILECSYDPNDKQVTPIGETDAHYIMNGTDLEYMIRFQNTGTAPAFNINVNDMLDPDLNYDTFEFIASSHACQPTINSETGEVNFYFADILLPDSVSDEPGSHGFIRYRISPYDALAENTIIENTAYIYFDFNPAVVTNTVANTISDLYFGIEEYGNMNISLFPNPADNRVVLHNTSTYAIDQLRIVDTAGRMVMQENNRIIPGQQTKLNVTTLEEGLYLLEATGTEGISKTKLVIRH